MKTIRMTPTMIEASQHKVAIGMDESEPGGDWEGDREVIEEIDRALGARQPGKRSRDVTLSDAAAKWLSCEMANAAAIAWDQADHAESLAEERRTRYLANACVEAAGRLHPGG